MVPVSLLPFPPHLQESLSPLPMSIASRDKADVRCSGQPLLVFLGGVQARNQNLPGCLLTCWGISSGSSLAELLPIDREVDVAVNLLVDAVVQLDHYLWKAPRRSAGPLVDFGVGLERPPRKPEVVGVNNWR